MQPTAPQQPSGCLSWPVVILALIFFWPVGLVLLGLRLSNDRAQQMALGWIFLVLGSLFALVCFGGAAYAPFDKGSDNGGNNLALAATLFLFGLGGVAIAAKGQGLRKKRKLVQHYIALIVNQGLTEIEEITTASGRRDSSAVMKEIQKLVHEGFFPGYRVDTNARLVLQFGSHEHSPEEVGFTCKSCGANNMILATGAYIRCEYCGTPVKV